MGRQSPVIYGNVTEEGSLAIQWEPYDGFIGLMSHVNEEFHSLVVFPRAGRKKSRVLHELDGRKVVGIDRSRYSGVRGVVDRLLP